MGLDNKILKEEKNTYTILYDNKRKGRKEKARKRLYLLSIWIIGM